MAFKTVLSAAMVATLMSAASMVGSAHAQDSVSMTDAGFDWDGFYVGLGVNVGQWSGTNPLTAYMPRLEAGFNHTLGENFVVGIEASVAQGWLSAGWSAFEGELDAQAGLAFDDVLLYVSGGVGYYCMRGDILFAKAGAGVQFAVTDNVSFDIEYQYWGNPNTRLDSHHVGVSTVWHF